MPLRSMPDEFIRPLDKVFHIGWSVCPPSCCPSSIEVFTGGIFGVIIVGYTKIFNPKQFKHWACSHSCHVTALMVEPFGIANGFCKLFRKIINRQIKNTRRQGLNVDSEI